MNAGGDFEALLGVTSETEVGVSFTFTYVWCAPPKAAHVRMLRPGYFVLERVLVGIAFGCAAFRVGVRARAH